MGYESRLFINNEYVDSKEGETFSVVNPNDDSTVAEGVQAAGEADVDFAVECAAKAFKSWRSTSSAVKQKCMLKMADLMEKDIEKFAKFEAMCMGQPISVARKFCSSTVPYWRYYAGCCDKLQGESFPEDGDARVKITQYMPFGVCAGIAAWNGTQVTAVKKIAPAIAAGNTFIFKASEKSPLGAIALGELIKEAGFPPGVINIVSGPGKTGQLLSQHMDIGKISFTGSVVAGRKVQDAATKSNLKRVTLELGGKSPAIIFNDANLDNALTMNSQGFLVNTGQICAAASRALVQEKIAPDFLKGLKEKFEKMNDVMGDPMDQNMTLGPLADKAQYERVMSFLESGKSSGAEIVTGGNRKGDKGCYIEPTIFMNPDNKAKIWTNEIFGPVISIKTFKTEEEAIEMANDTSYGLAASIYTTDVTRAMRVSNLLEAGTVTINAPYGGLLSAPFGGMKQSGYGRESGKYGLSDWMQPKAVVFNMNVPSKD